MAVGPHISLSAETLFEVSGFSVTNSTFTTLIISTIIILLALFAKATIKPTDKPTGFQNFMEMVVESLYNFTHSVTNDTARTKLFFPYIATFFIFILLNNWTSILPGVGTIGYTHEPESETLQVQLPNISPKQVMAAEESSINEAAPEAAFSLSESSESDETHAETATFVPYFRPATADLNGTLALALISVFLTQTFGVRYLKLGYFKKFINFSNPLMFFVGILELISEFAKIVSFAFRLFGNVFAGEVLLVVVAFLVPLVLPMPFYGLEIFVGFIQALVFAMLSLVFFNMATVSHDDH